MEIRQRSALGGFCFATLYFCLPYLRCSDESKRPCHGTCKSFRHWLHYYADPGRFLRLARPALPRLAAISFALTEIGLIRGYGFAPADWEQDDAARIIYVHVPAAWVAMAGYTALAVCSFFSIIWRHPLADLAAEEIGPVGAGFTFVCLVSGSLRGKPMWGAYWVWDARLTSVLVPKCLKAVETTGQDQIKAAAFKFRY
jgi:ABC-type transport system involved in cytochrome c biogenesis permease subunit